MTLIAAADGSALGNPGPAGWGWYVDPDHWACGGWPHGTNNMGELTAVLDLLRQTAALDDDLLVYCDSLYVINSVTKWMPGWKAKGWRKGDGKPVLNVEIMKELDTAMRGRRVRFEWVKGHAGHPLNEAADRLANGAAAAYAAGRIPDPGPGFGVPPLEGRPSTSSGRVSVEPRPELVDPRPEPVEGRASTSSADAPDDLFSADEPSDEEQVVALERSLLTDAVRADPAAVAALLHPDWTEIGRSGRLWKRDEMLAAIAPLEAPARLSVISVDRVDRDTILLIWRAETDGASTLRSSLWVGERGHWRQRFHQGTAEP